MTGPTRSPCFFSFSSRDSEAARKFVLVFQNPLTSCRPAENRFGLLSLPSLVSSGGREINTLFPRVCALRL